jgi:pyrroloquinoline quinone biosynthesis protein B
MADTMKIRVLGSAAGGGFPQWNCNCPNCRGVRDGTVSATPRTQSSIAISSDGKGWVLFNASPDLPAQLRAFPALQPGRTLRDSAIVAVVLVDAQLDHTLGLLTLREGKPLPVWCTDRVQAELTEQHAIFPILNHYCGVDRQRIPVEPNAGFTIPGLPHVQLAAVAVEGNAPPFSPRRDRPEPGDNIGLCLRDSRSDKTLFYAPGLGSIEPVVRPFLERADVLLVDGTFWHEDELIRLGVSKRSARQMGHLPQSGEGGMLEALEGLSAARKILIHINNTNPVLNDESPERERLRKSGIELAYDGMELEI